MFCLPSLPLCVQLGNIISGRYRLEGVLGAGRPGIVVGATDLLLGDRVAIHFMPSRMQDGPAARRLGVDFATAVPLFGEARLIGAGVLDDGTLYRVIRNLDKSDLRRLLCSDGMPWFAEVELGRERARLRLKRLRSSTRCPDSIRRVLPRARSS